MGMVTLFFALQMKTNVLGGVFLCDLSILSKDNFAG